MDNTNSQDESVVEGEIVETEPKSGNVQAVNTLLSLETLIKTDATVIDRLRVELKKLKETQEDAFANDPTYIEHCKQAKEATKIRNTTKQQILKQPSVNIISNKIKSLMAEIKEKQMALSDYLKEYQRMTGANEIQTDTGEVMEIVTEVKLVRRTQNKKA